MPRYEYFKLIIDGQAGNYTIEAQGPRQIHVAPLALPLALSAEFHAAVTAMQNGEAITRRDLELVGE